MIDAKPRALVGDAGAARGPRAGAGAVGGIFAASGAAGDEAHAAALAGLEAHGGPRGNVQAETARLLAVESQGRVGLKEMIVAADLDRAVAHVCDIERQLHTAGVEFDVGIGGDEFARDHAGLIGSARAR